MHTYASLIVVGKHDQPIVYASSVTILVLGLRPKGLQGCEPREEAWELESQWTPECSEKNCKGQTQWIEEFFIPLESY